MSSRSLCLFAALLLSGCSAIVGSGAAYPVSWRLAHQLSPEATAVDLLIHETECAGGSNPEGRILPPTVAYTPTSIWITVEVNGSVYKGCQTNPEYPLTVNLRESVGNRDVVNGVAQQSLEPGATPI
ncbi:MAG: hypothetical protein ABI797_02575 [Chloroflexota bacterium]